MDSDNAAYNEYLKKRIADMETEGSVMDESGDIPESAGSSDVMKTRQMQDQAALESQKQQGGGELEKGGAALTTAGAVGGNPYVAGAGLALQTVGAVDSAHRAGEQSKIDAYNKKIMAQRSAIRNIFA